MYPCKSFIRNSHRCLNSQRSSCTKYSHMSCWLMSEHIMNFYQVLTHLKTSLENGAKHKLSICVYVNLWVACSKLSLSLISSIFFVCILLLPFAITQISPISVLNTIHSVTDFCNCKVFSKVFWNPHLLRNNVGL